MSPVRRSPSTGSRPPRSSPRHRARTAVVACLALLAAGSLGTAPATAADSADRCGFATIIGVRGSGERAGSGTGATPSVYAQGTGGFGPRLAGVMRLLAQEPNLPIHREALRYPATGLPSATDPVYAASRRAGVVALRTEIESLAHDCPTTTIQLAGQGQGAQVVGDVLADGAALSAEARSLMAGVVLFGDPAYRHAEPWDAEGNGTRDGILVRPAGAFDGWVASSTLDSLPVPMIRSWCLSGDGSCQSGGPGTGRASSSNPVTRRAAAEFLESFLYSVD